MGDLAPCGDPAIPGHWFCRGCKYPSCYREHLARPRPIRKVIDGPTQLASGYTKNVTPRGTVVRPEDAFPESCCEGGPMEERDE